MRRFSWPALVLVLLLAPGIVFAQGSTDTPTPSETPTPTATATAEATLAATMDATATNTPTPTPDLYWVFTLPSGKSGAVLYTVSTGDLIVIALLIVMLMAIWFGLFVLLRQQNK